MEKSSLLKALVFGASMLPLAAFAAEQKQELLQSKQQTQKKGNDKMTAGEAFLAENKNKKGVVTLTSGLQYKIIKEGDGKKPSATDTVKVHYAGTLVDGTKFDSSYDRGQPASFPVNAVIPGWVEALQLMKEGSTWELYIPSNLAYGSRGAGSVIGPDEVLIFTVELLSIQ